MDPIRDTDGGISGWLAYDYFQYAVDRKLGRTGRRGGADPQPNRPDLTAGQKASAVLAREGLRA